MVSVHYFSVELKMNAERPEHHRKWKRSGAVGRWPEGKMGGDAATLLAGRDRRRTNVLHTAGGGRVVFSKVVACMGAKFCFVTLIKKSRLLSST